ncbi:MAG: hypothetical protein QE493_03765 [Verrucomicrobiae bacterium]|jgi:hypothetical protein|nr:hypothetical protein [Verrucomicrobiae bacterium]
MNIPSCFSIPHNRLVNPKTEYERSCEEAFINASLPPLRKKPVLREPSKPKKKNIDIFLDGKPHFN